MEYNARNWRSIYITQSSTMCRKGLLTTGKHTDKSMSPIQNVWNQTKIVKYVKMHANFGNRDARRDFVHGN